MNFGDRSVFRQFEGAKSVVLYCSFRRDVRAFFQGLGALEISLSRFGFSVNRKVAHSDQLEFKEEGLPFALNWH